MNFIQRLRLKMTLPAPQFKWAELQNEAREIAKNNLRAFVADRLKQQCDPPGAVKTARNMIWAYAWTAPQCLTKLVWEGFLEPLQPQFSGFGTSNWLHFVGAMNCVDFACKNLAREPRLLILDGAQHTYQLPVEFVGDVFEHAEAATDAESLLRQLSRRLFDEIRPLLKLPEGSGADYLFRIQCCVYLAKVAGASYSTPGWKELAGSMLD